MGARQHTIVIEGKELNAARCPDCGVLIYPVSSIPAHRERHEATMKKINAYGRFISKPMRDPGPTAGTRGEKQEGIRAIGRNRGRGK